MKPLRLPNHLRRHILRASAVDPLAQVTLKADGVTPRSPVKTRPGKPRAGCLSNTAGEGQVFDARNLQDLNTVMLAAIQREGLLSS